MNTNMKMAVDEFAVTRQRHNRTVLVALDPEGPYGDYLTTTVRNGCDFEVVIVAAKPMDIPPIVFANQFGFAIGDDAWTEARRHVDLDVAEASRILDDQGVPNRVADVEYRPSIFDRWSRRNLARAIAKVGDEIGADFIVVGASDRHEPSLGALVRRHSNRPVGRALSAYTPSPSLVA